MSDKLIALAYILKIIEEFEEELEWTALQLNTTKEHNARYRNMLKQITTGYDTVECERCEEIWFLDEFCNGGGNNGVCGMCIEELKQ